MGRRIMKDHRNLGFGLVQALILSAKLQQRLAMANDGLSLQMKDVSDAHLLAPSRTEKTDR